MNYEPPNISDEYIADAYAREPELVRKHREETAALPGLLEQALSLAEREYLEDRLNPILRHAECDAMSLLIHARITGAIRRLKFQAGVTAAPFPVKALWPPIRMKACDNLVQRFEPKTITESQVQAEMARLQKIQESALPTPAASPQISDRQG